VRRYLSGRLHLDAAQGQAVEVRVRISLLEEGDCSSVELSSLCVNGAGADVLLRLEAEGFDVGNDPEQLLHTPADRPSNWAIFELHPQPVEQKVIRVSAYHQQRLLGTLSHRPDRA
jgi:hypothetical protein